MVAQAGIGMDGENMRFYIANERETLRDIAGRANVSLEEIISLDPRVTNSDANLFGRQVKLPLWSVSAENRKQPASSAPLTDFRNEWIRSREAY